MSPHEVTPEREVFLQPGDVWFGEGHVRVRTLLGSCVAVTLWHPTRHMGGMCHYMLADRPVNRGPELDGRYAPDAIAMMHRSIIRYGSRPEDYQAKLFGGGRMFDVKPSRSGVWGVQDRNIQAADELMTRYGITVAARHMGDDGHRTLYFDLWTGDVWVRHRRTLGLEQIWTEGQSS